MAKRERFNGLLLETGRRGIANVLAELGRLGFYEAPASTRFHGNYPGGLLEHSLCVYDEAVAIREAQLKLKPEVAGSMPLDSIAIAALLYDVCKAEVYKSQQKWKKGRCWAMGVVRCIRRRLCSVPAWTRREVRNSTSALGTGVDGW